MMMMMIISDIGFYHTKSANYRHFKSNYDHYWQCCWCFFGGGGVADSIKTKTLIG